MGKKESVKSVSSYEVETQLLIATKIGYIDKETHQDLYDGIVEIEKQIAGLIRTLRS